MRPSAPLLFVLGLACGCVIEVLVKSLGGRLPIAELLFFRMLFALPLVLIIGWKRGVERFHLAHPWRHGLRAVVQLGSLGLWFVALPHLPLAAATALSFTAPVFVVVLGMGLLGERPGFRSLLALLLGLAGVALVLRPTYTPLIPAVLVLAAAALRAWSTVQVRQLSQTDGVAAAVLVFTLAGLLLTLPVLPWVWVPPIGDELALLALIGLLGGASQWLAVAALFRAPASQLAPLDYLRLPMAAILAILAWGEVPSVAAMVGFAAILSAAGLARRR